MIEIIYHLLGHLFYKIGWIKLGHKMVAMSIAGDFGTAKKTRKWLIDNCPYNCSNCSNCRLWTCNNYKKG